MKRFFSSSAEESRLVGWRQAGVVGLLSDDQIVEVAFESLNQADLFGASAKAVCRNRMHAAPASDCSCGFYSLKDRDQIRLGAYAGHHSRASNVLLRVRLSGTVVEGERGLRASHQTVERVELPAVCTHRDCDSSAEFLFATGDTAAINLAGRWVRLQPVCGDCVPRVDAVLLPISQIPTFSGVAEVSQQKDLGRLQEVRPPAQTKLSQTSPTPARSADDALFVGLSVATFAGALLAFAVLFFSNPGEMSPSDLAGFDPRSPLLWPLVCLYVVTLSASLLYAKWRRYSPVPDQFRILLGLSPVAAGTSLVAGVAGFFVAGGWPGWSPYVAGGLVALLVAFLLGLFLLLVITAFTDPMSSAYAPTIPALPGVLLCLLGWWLAGAAFHPTLTVASPEEAAAVFSEVVERAGPPLWLAKLESEASSPGELAGVWFEAPDGEVVLVEGYWLSSDGRECWTFPQAVLPSASGDDVSARPEPSVDVPVVLTDGGRAEVRCGPALFPSQ